MSYTWSYAPTDRAKCKGKCKEKIPKGEIRFGVSSEGFGDFETTQYRCLACVTDKQIDNVIKAVGGLDKVAGFDTLCEEDQGFVMAKMPSGGSGGGSSSSSSLAAAAPAAPKRTPKAKVPTAPPAAPPKRLAKTAAAMPAPPKAGVRRKAPVSEDEQHKFLDKAKAQDWPAVKEMLEANPQLVNVQPAGRWSALHQFASANNIEAVKYLLARGADPEAVAGDGKSAKSVGKGPCFGLLVQAAEKKNKIPSIEDQHKFLDKAKERDWPGLKAMLDDTPALVNVQPAGRWSALHQFAAAGNVEAVKSLLEQGANASACTKDGSTAKDLAKGGCVALIAGHLGEGGAGGDDEEDEDDDEEEEDEEDEEDEDDEDDEEEDAEEKEPSPPPEPAPKPAGAKRKAGAAAVASSSSAGPAKKAKTGPSVDAAVPCRGDYMVVDDWSVLLNQTNLVANNNKYFRIQVLKNADENYFCWTHWGRVGLSGQSKLDPCGKSQTAAEAACKKKFREKTGVAYEAKSEHDWTPVVGKYTLVDTKDKSGDEGGGEGAPLGKLSAAQIAKGQDVLTRIEAALDGGTPMELMNLSSEYYTLIPHVFGMMVPPPINTNDLLEKEQELLKFYLRMGFEEIEKTDDGLTPVNGVMELPLPASLEAACNKLCAAKDIKACNEKGKMHAARQSGNPSTKMETHLYGAVMLYTSNAIYRDLNKVLRGEDRSKVKKYFNYLRLFLEALGRLPQATKSLWRGMNVDLFDEYKLGKTVTWWGVSSCTSDINVAKNFMKGCGGACTLLTVKAKTAADISAITFFGNEKEHLLAPGTKLKVLSASRSGKATEISLEEVGRVLD